MNFFEALVQFSFLQHALLGGVLASIGCGVMGTYVVVKRISFLAGGIAHAVLGGMGLAYYFQGQPIIGALIAAILSALLIGWIKLRWQENEDTLISAIWAIGMAVGILFISQTPGYNTDLMSYLFGNILLVTQQDLYLMLVLDILILATVLLFYKQFLAVTFDEEFARLRGIKVEVFYLLLLCLVALTVVLLIQLVGLILVIALLSLPAAIARQHFNSLPRIMGFAVLLGIIFTGGGLMLAYSPDLPAGATIILFAGSGYLLSSLIKYAKLYHISE
ncbi:metal ABC transporter permease [Candidatus Venteria ishoeyi]|uniref:High-affinity zinc uptake system membrane protein ZnuB n=1 Tax=Candidatus Venteria ishoeyi TaxID=1899563 RepID=A0A1H6FB86_9GAMM|nr:metal ABC transporter permease [Candidatus Venteria ishoeyi]MDM8546950.1 metal ABC transporter permease [Candidatus Venteria ishoeyi]SEH07352.1 High-affinity zinc uptake system membrane protein ZnuB [Candidatus Venteria ishoeyi]